MINNGFIGSNFENFGIIDSYDDIGEQGLTNREGGIINVVGYFTPCNWTINNFGTINLLPSVGSYPFNGFSDYKQEAGGLTIVDGILHTDRLHNLYGGTLTGSGTIAFNNNGSGIVGNGGGQTFNISPGSPTGDNLSFNYPTLPNGLTWEVEYTSKSVIIKVI